MIRFLILIVLSGSLVSCKKEKLVDAAPSLVGTWKHYSATANWHIIEIYDNGEGKLQWYVDGKLEKFTKVRTWYMEDNTIYFGKLALNGELYEVIDFPAISGAEVIENYDTLKVGKRFMRLDDGYFVEQ